MRRPGYLRALFAVIIAVCVALVLLAMSRSSAQVSVVADYSTPNGAQTTPPGTRLISLQTKDLIVDSSQAIYASVPGTAGAAGNSLTRIDPVAGSVGNSVFVGSEPGRLAISDNHQFIYAALDGEGGVRRFDVSSQTPQLKFSLGTSPSNGPYFVDDIAVVPGSPQSVAISRQFQNLSPRHAGVVVYDDDVPRPTVTDRSQATINQIEFSNSATTLYGSNNETTGLEFFKLSVTPAGVSILNSTPGLMDFGPIVFEGGRIYLGSGRVIDPEAGTVVGNYTGMNFFPFNAAKSVVVDSVNDRVYFLTGGGVDPGSNGFTHVYAFNKTSFSLIASVDIFLTTGPVSSLVQYSQNGLAFRDDNTVYLINAPGSIPSASPTPTPNPSPSPTPTPTPTPAPGELRELSLATKDLIVEPNSQTIYASSGDSLAHIDPVAGSVGSSVAIGIQADKLAVTDNGQYIYVGLDGENSINRFDVATQSSSLKFSVTSKPVDIETMPGAPGTIAIVRNQSVPEVVVYDGNAARPLTNLLNVTRLAFSNSPAVLYGYNTDSSAFQFSKMVVGSCGVGLSSSVSGLISGNVYDIRYDNGRLYSAGGRVIDPETNTLLGSFFVPVSGFAFVQTESKANKIYSLTTDGSAAVLRVFDMQNFALIGVLTLPGVTGIPTSFVRWGTDGLAFNTPTKVFLLEDPLIGGSSSSFTPAPTAVVSKFTVHGQVSAIGNPVSGVTISFSGLRSGTTQTDANGNFAIDDLDLCGTLTITPSKVNHIFTPSSIVITNPSNQRANFEAFHRIIGFALAQISVNETANQVFLPVIKSSGIPPLPADLLYATSNGSASDRSDYTAAYGTFHMDSNTGQAPIQILITDDILVEGNETFTVTLQPVPGFDVVNPTVTVTIIDNDTVVPVTNPLEGPIFFVRIHYHDFLNREPDPAGLAFWTDQITSCGADQACIELKRINVSAAFYISIEFQETGYLVERIYKTAYGDALGTSTFGGSHQLPVPVIRLNEFLFDTHEIGQGVVVGQGNWLQQLEDNKQAFAAEFVQRSRFTTAYPLSMTAAQFVDTLNGNAGNPLSQTERDQLVTDLSTNAKTRAQVLRAVAEDPDLNSAEFNRAFVLMQYFGYLRRNPNDPQDSDYTGYDFWLTKLNQFNGNFVNAEMVKAFISSGEYRGRFGP